MAILLNTDGGSKGNTRDLLFANQDPAAVLSVGRSLASNVAESVPPSMQFGLAVTSLLRKYQQLGRQQAQNQLALTQTERSNRVSNTPQSLIGASPELQESARAVHTGALAPTFAGVQEAEQGFSQNINEIAGIVTQVQQVMQAHEQQRHQQRQELLQSLSLAAQAGSPALEGLRKTNPEVFKAAGIDADSYIAGIKAQEQRGSGAGGSSDTPDIKEFRFAKQQGFTGSFTDYLKVKGGLSGGGLDQEFNKQNVLDFQTVSSAYNSIIGVIGRTNKTPENFTETDAKKLTDADAISIGKALARIQLPDVARQGVDVGNALEATSLAEEVTATSRRLFKGRRYLPSKLVDAVTTARNLYENRRKSLAGGDDNQPLPNNQVPQTTRTQTLPVDRVNKYRRIK